MIFVTCELNIHSGSLKSRQQILLLVVVQQRVQSTRSLASRLLFCQVDAMVRTSITRSSSVILCVRRYPACILLTCVLVRSCDLLELNWGRGHSWQRAEEFLLPTREGQPSVHPKNTNVCTSHGNKWAQHHTLIRCVA